MVKQVNNSSLRKCNPANCHVFATIELQVNHKNEKLCNL